MLEYLRSIVRALREILELLDQLHHSLPGDVGSHISTIKGRNTAMAAIITQPTVTMSDVERVLITLSPKLPDGTTDPGPFSWSSSDVAIGQLVGVDASGDPDLLQVPTGTQAWLLTPAGAGSVGVTITSASPNVDGNLIPFELTEGRTGNVNASVGAPVPDNNS